ncbi:MAG: purine nucleosidase [Candidatus Promineifilaceae bacterium]|jgi:purine nucleosidase
MTNMIIFDTDLGLGTPRCEVDDGAALIQLLGLFPGQVAAVTTVHGNGDIEDVMQNTCRLLSYLGREDIPVGRGAASGLIEQKLWFQEWQDGYGQTPKWPIPATFPASANLIIDLVRAHPHEVTIIAVGPLTNLALALRLAPDIEPLVKQIVTMGGSFGDAEPTPEFNAQCDPEAAHVVLTAEWPIKIIGLNITKQIPFSLADFASLPEWNPAITLLKQCAPAWIERVTGMGWGDGDCSLHDALAVSAAADPTLFTWQAMSVDVALVGAERGITRMLDGVSGEIENGASVQVAIAVDVEKCRDLIWQHLVNPRS